MNLLELSFLPSRWRGQDRQSSLQWPGTEGMLPTSQESSKPERENRIHTAGVFILSHSLSKSSISQWPTTPRMCALSKAIVTLALGLLRAGTGLMPSSTGTLSFLFFSNGVLGASLCQALGSKCHRQRRSGRGGITGSFL